MPLHSKFSGQLGPLPVRRKRCSPLDFTGNNELQRKTRKLSSAESGEGCRVQGFARFEAPDDARIFFARNIAVFPASPKVTNRIIFWTDGSVRDQCGGAAGVWKETAHAANETHTQWKQLEKCFPTQTNNIDAVELLAIVEVMKKALELVDEPSANALSHQRSNVPMFKYRMQTYANHLTRSHAHISSNEVLIFTDSTNALTMISNFDIRNMRGNPLQLEQVMLIYHLSRQMKRSGIHLEFQWSKGHFNIPGNQRADRAAGELSRRMRQMKYHSLSPEAKKEFEKSSRGR
ncbi:hypothetical protein LTR66_015636 [Elasticomyces elasticus]|nr:hypothetical protein LTR66_015636 [Elasticomyces elasticus]